LGCWGGAWQSSDPRSSSQRRSKRSGHREVGRPNELLQDFKIDELVVENDVLFDLVLLGKDFEAHAIGFAMHGKWSSAKAILRTLEV
jgi:hypothetical protein